MHTYSAMSKIRGVSVSTWAAVLLCAAASCSRSTLGGSGPDGAVDGPMASGGAAGGTTSSAGTSNTGGATGGVTGSATTSSPGGTTSTAGNTGAAGMTGLGGAVTGGASSLRDGGVGGSVSGGAVASGGVATTGAAGAGGGKTGGSSGVGGSATGGSKPDGGIAPTPDASVRIDGRWADAMTYTEFGKLIAGTWLVGWSSGDARRYSWVRLSGAESGAAEYSSGADLPSNTPLWACDGQSTWFMTAAFYSIMLRFPSSCPSGLPSYFTFQELPDTAVPPPGATFGMIAPSVASEKPSTEWWRYPDDQCDAAMSACKSPF